MQDPGKGHPLSPNPQLIRTSTLKEQRRTVCPTASPGSFVSAKNVLKA
ncbi:hypothetical protein OOU_Y34scaffold00608g7 [Pyricularia oryzae Y34]|uniref:Uncharacterized protein n=3 Tax=Pyricularia oryzae TaxID=318829 RepID=A0A4P7NLE6_PYROR|nr:hypothetical protein OOU_Y34scaffold00608g7 [Pyricularia oryzae Y34]QBZ62974.1 hypothetical protein PoMZ_11864 [Pyricularia oryzae]